MSIVAALLLVTASPVDPAELAKAQAALESYLSRLETIEMSYTVERTPAPGARDQGDAELLDEYELLYAYPSIRLKALERRKGSDGEVVELRYERRLHKRVLVEIDYTHKHHSTITAPDPDPITDLPLMPLGLRVFHTLNTPISDFLRYPDVTTVDGTDMIDGQRVTVVTIGPNISKPPLPLPWSSAAYLRLSLAPTYSYLPIRTEIMQPFDSERESNYHMSLSSFKPVRDLNRSSEVPFPHRIELQWPSGGKTIWTIERASINRQVSESDFLMTPPTGYFVTVDHKRQVIAGGPAALDAHVRTTVEGARQLLTTVDPPRSAPVAGWFRWPAVFALVGTVILAVALFYKWRFQ